MLKRISSILITTILLVLVSLEPVLSQTKQVQAPWFFVQLSDPQFGMFEKNKGFGKETMLYEVAVAKINKLKPDFVVITGDFVQDQNSEEQIEEFKWITNKIDKDIPVYLSPGNHDVGKVPDKQSLKKYRKNYGKDRFSFNNKRATLIGFNTSLIKGKLVDEERKQLSWLKKQLKKNQNSEHIILFCHYPFFDKNVDEATAYGNINLESRKEYLDLFEANKVDAVFCGHRHRNNLKTYGSVQLVTTSALGKPLGKDPSGLRIVKVLNDRIEHEYYGLQELPDSISFDN